MIRALGLTLTLVALGCQPTSEPPSNPESQPTSNAVGGEVTLEEATAIALASVPGELDEAELEMEDGLTAYSIDIVRDGTEIEVRVDPSSGVILSISDDDADRADEEDDDDGL